MAGQLCQIVADVDSGLCLALPDTSVFQIFEDADHRIVCALVQD